MSTRPRGSTPASRPWARLLPVLLLAALIAGLALWLRPPVRGQAEFLVFGSTARIDLRASGREQADAALAAIGNLLAADHRAWHAWEPSEVTRLNTDLAAGRERRVPADIAAMIVEAHRGYVLSEGLFNPAAGKLIGAWGFHTSRYPVESSAPTAKQVDALRQSQPSMVDVRVAADGTISSRNRAVALDLNGLAEGFAAAQVRALLDERGIHDALIYIGGFVLALGQDQGRPWRVGINAPQGVLGSIELRNGESVASSGDYQRRRADAPTQAPGQGHILDVQAGRPQRASAAASVVGPDPVLADMAATALMVAGPERFEPLVAGMGLSCALLLAHDGTLHITAPLQRRLHLTQSQARPLRVHEVPGADC